MLFFVLLVNFHQVCVWSLAVSVLPSLSVSVIFSPFAVGHELGSTETDFKRHFPWCPAAVSESNSRGLDESAEKVSGVQKGIGLKGKCCIGSGSNLIQRLYDMNDVTVR